MKSEHRFDMDSSVGEPWGDQASADTREIGAWAVRTGAGFGKVNGAESGPVRTERVEALQMALSQGFYLVSVSRLADCLMTLMLRRP